MLLEGPVESPESSALSLCSFLLFSPIGQFINLRVLVARLCVPSRCYQLQALSAHFYYRCKTKRLQISVFSSLRNLFFYIGMLERRTVK